MSGKLAFIGAPSSAGAYAPGQEKAPAALRAAGIIGKLKRRRVDCADFGDIAGFRWRADPEAPRAMNAVHVERAASAVAGLVETAMAQRRTPLVIGGDCTIELGTLAGVMRSDGDVGLIYFDLDADMNTPQTTTGGALDWRGVAHMLGLDGTVKALSGLGPRMPMLPPGALLLFGVRNIKPCEQEWIDRFEIRTIHAEAVAADPQAAARGALAWAKGFERIVLHFDVDVIDYEDFPIAENTRRKMGLTFHQAMTAFENLVASENLAAATICEINPDHGLANGSTLEAFAARIASAFGPR